MLSLVFLLAVALQGESQAPIKFRGAYIGQSVADYVDCSGSKPRKLKESYRLNGKLCQGGQGRVFSTKSKGLMHPTTYGEILLFENRAVVEIKILIADDEWEKVKYDLTQKMGEPSIEQPQVFQNGFGARWEFGQAVWQKDNLVALARVRVITMAGRAVPRSPFSGPGPQTEGVEVIIMDAVRAELPSTKASILD
jgi:hypothetical protein